jgi:RNA polymerase sigma-70 factor (ECF subfamily)
MKTNSIQFESLYSSLYSKVLQFVSFKVNNYDLAKDITGDIFLKLYEKMSTFDPSKASINTWAWTVVKNSMIDYYRVKKLNAIQLSHMSGEDDAVFELPSSYDTFKEVSSNETMARIINAISDLPESHREIVYLNLVEDMKLEEVASRTNTPLGTVKVYVMKAKGILAKKLNDLA